MSISAECGGRGPKTHDGLASDTLVTLDDGRKLWFVVCETAVGECGVDICIDTAATTNLPVAAPARKSHKSPHRCQRSADEMQLLYTDEVNTNPDVADFFVYAGVSIPGDHACDLSDEINAIRQRNGYKGEDLLKFNTKERPPHITPAVHATVKQATMEAAARHGVRLFASFILHNIATDPKEARRKEINRICYHFNCFLTRIRDHGLVLIDTFTDNALSAILREKFSVGLRELPYSKIYPLRQILGYHLASIGTSHFCSLIDIVLGGLRYAINSRNDENKVQAVSAILRQISQLCLRTSSNTVDELSIFFSPKIVRVPAYLQVYQTLWGFLARHGMEAAQRPTDQRTY
jgi:hypothetical protein